MNLPKGIRQGAANQQGLKDLCAWLPSKIAMGRMVEIGVYMGESTTIFGQHFEEVWAVDPWLGGFDPADPTSNANGIEVAKRAMDAVAGQPNVHLVQATGDEFAEIVNDWLFDFVYIDAMHTYEAASNDIETWLDLVHPHGVIAGHDYSWNFPGVKEAVDEHFDKVHTFQDTSWAYCMHPEQRASQIVI